MKVVVIKGALLLFCLLPLAIYTVPQTPAGAAALIDEAGILNASKAGTVDPGRADDLYEQGLRIKEQQGPEAATRHWLESYRELREEGRHDPRIGFHFIELVFSHEQGLYRDRAAEIYFWGLGAEEVDPYREALQQEVEYLSPLIDQPVYEEWVEMIERDDPAIYSEIASFWQEHNIVLSTELNERLLEHWDRIAHAREHFTENSESVYGTDDRGEIYVRLGEPDDRHTGSLGNQTNAIRGKLYDLVNQGIINNRNVRDIEREITMLFSSTQYELWQYRNVNQEDFFFLFGEPGGGGSFGLRDSLEDFVSTRAFNNTVVGRRGQSQSLRAGNLIQFMIYNEMSVYDMFFGEMLQEYESNWMDALRGGGGFQGSTLRNRNAPRYAERATQEIYDKAPATSSRFERYVQEYDLATEHYAFLDEDRRPVFYDVIQAFPEQILEDAFVRDYLQEHAEHLSIRQGLTEHDQTGQHYIASDTQDVDDMQVLRDLRPVTLLRSGLSPSQRSGTLLFSELYLYDGESQDLYGAPQHQLVAMSKAEREPGEPLDPAAEELMMSRVVLGSTGRPPQALRRESLGILADRQLRLGENLQAYFEIYNLASGDQNLAQYTISYRLEGHHGMWDRILDRVDDDVVTLQWEAASETWNDHQFFEVDLSEFEPGDYTLHLTIEEELTGQTAERSVDFEIVE